VLRPSQEEEGIYFFNWRHLTTDMTRPVALPVKWQGNGKGLYFEAYNWNGRSLSVVSGVGMQEVEGSEV